MSDDLPKKGGGPDGARLEVRKLVEQIQQSGGR